MSYHVTPDGSGGWKVVIGGIPHPLGVFSTQQEAIEFGRPRCQQAQDELLIHNRKGRIRQKDSYGNDPCPPLDKNGRRNK
ncbi:MAG: hypothetical protein BWK73_48635 [Thiothrix lacustris]|uniref:DUF2188 domain-containing protein n=1 Tax=Thiothrix lacustris TaxID=525917 RepID=A0A1Y1Q999_9GAMM|nr:MAG: hypothetical protein BWK73_48635 [Thiothrix lacustris]